MRIRTRNLDSSKPKWRSKLTLTNLTTGQVIGPNPSSQADHVPFRKKQDTISDELGIPVDGPTRAKEKRRKEHLTRMLAAINRRDASVTWRVSPSGSKYLSESGLQVHRCTHTKTYLEFNPDFAMVSNLTSGGFFRVKAHTFTDGAFLSRVLGDGTNPLTSGIWNTKHYTADGYYTPDWFALLEKFHDASNSILPSSSLIGESMVEHAIFVDAFKAILNPTSLVKTFVKRFSALGVKTLRRITLGQVRKTLKDGTSAYLGYQFAVKPAVEEIKKVLTAHDVVQRRLNYLRNNGGNYVPVRVRGSLPSAFENQALPLPGPNNRKVLLDYKDTTAVISAWAKVREDLNLGATWDAYLQYFGAKRIFELAWELVPMSFVVDWFTNAQDYVHKYMSPPNVNPFYNLRGLSHSITNTISEGLWYGTGYRFAEDNFLTVNPSEAFKICSRITRSYTRLPSLPKSSGSVDFSNLGLFHYISLGAMLLQKKL